MSRRILSLVAFVLVACSEGSGPPGEEILEPTTATITVQNDGGAAIANVFFTPCDIAEWATSQLNPGETIAVGATRSWTVEAGCWDLRTETIGGLARQFFDVTIAAGETRVFRIS